MNITMQSIEKAPNGYYVVPCDGRHETNFHKYLYYSKKEVLEIWRETHDDFEQSH